MDFLQWKLVYVNSIFTEICSQGPNKRYSNIDSENGLAPKMWQAILNQWWLDYRRKYVFLGLNELKKSHVC